MLTAAPTIGCANSMVAAHTVANSASVENSDSDKQNNSDSDKQNNSDSDWHNITVTVTDTIWQWLIQ